MHDRGFVVRRPTNLPNPCRSVVREEHPHLSAFAKVFNLTRVERLSWNFEPLDTFDYHVHFADPRNGAHYFRPRIQTGTLWR